MQIKLKSCFINSTKKDGTSYINKNGEPFKMCNITSENGNRASLYIGSTDTWKLEIVEKWKSGDEVNVNLTKSGEYINFDIIKPQVIVAEDPRQDEPTKEQITEMFSNPNIGEKDPISPADIPF